MAQRSVGPRQNAVSRGPYAPPAGRLADAASCLVAGRCLVVPARREAPHLLFPAVLAQQPRKRGATVRSLEGGIFEHTALGIVTKLRRPCPQQFTQEFRRKSVSRETSHGHSNEHRAEQRHLHTSPDSDPRSGRSRLKETEQRERDPGCAGSGLAGRPKGAGIAQPGSPSRRDRIRTHEPPPHLT